MHLNVLITLFEIWFARVHGIPRLEILKLGNISLSLDEYDKSLADHAKREYGILEERLPVPPKRDLGILSEAEIDAEYVPVIVEDPPPMQMTLPPKPAGSTTHIMDSTVLSPPLTCTIFNSSGSFAWNITGYPRYNKPRSLTLTKETAKGVVRLKKLFTLDDVLFVLQINPPHLVLGYDVQCYNNIYNSQGPKTYGTNYRLVVKDPEPKPTAEAPAQATQKPEAPTTTIVSVDNPVDGNISKEPTCNFTALINGPTYRIPDRSLTASSSYNRGHVPENSRLITGPCLDEKVCAWAPGRNKTGEYIQADLGQSLMVVKIATQGRGDPEGSWHFISKYNLAFSFDGIDFWTDDNGGQGYMGNSDPYTVSNKTLQKPVNARFVRLIIVEYNIAPLLRWEIFTCVTEAISPPDSNRLSTTVIPKATQDPPTRPPLFVSRSCGGGYYLRPPRQWRDDVLCRASCRQIFMSCQEIAYTWSAPIDRREEEWRCAGEACTCARRCIYKRPNHRSLPDGPKTSMIGGGMTRVFNAGSMDEGRGGVGGLGSIRGTDEGTRIHKPKKTIVPVGTAE